MRKYNNKLEDIGYLIYRWISQIVDPVQAVRGIPNYLFYCRDWIKYSNSKGSEQIKIIDTYPCIHDRTTTTNFDRHYFQQDIWAFKKIYKSMVKKHVDVGSRIDFVGLLTAITNVTFVDIRPLIVNLENFESRRGNILSMPYESDSVKSLSCLHVAEHIGLGRYGDPIDPFGTIKAAKELARILSPRGNLYFSLPLGKPRLCFNSHRIHSTQQILDYFSDLELIELSGIDDNGIFSENIDTDILDSCNYGCGLFWFKK
jgi:hypothetical protein